MFRTGEPDGAGRQWRLGSTWGGRANCRIRDLSTRQCTPQRKAEKFLLTVQSISGEVEVGIGTSPPKRPVPPSHVNKSVVHQAQRFVGAQGLHTSFEDEHVMLWTIFLVLLVLWALGLATGATLNGFIHILLVVAVVVVLIRIIQGRRPI
jgi:hypothetical protein